ncbi:MAG: hypothetical protein IPG43_09710 [Proteobacteria bacterium]|nr:hypothetical protein [Pseudomonadota bacterium]
MMRAWLLIVGIALGVAASALWQARHAVSPVSPAREAPSGAREAQATDDAPGAASSPRVHLDADARVGRHPHRARAG